MAAAGAAAACRQGKNGCVKCFKNKCGKCARGWLKHPKNVCLPCRRFGCKTCKWDKAAVCTSCAKDFWLKAGKCRSCPKGCSECYNKKGKAHCTACDRTYKLVGGKCVRRGIVATCPPLPVPVWRTDTVFGWDPVYGVNSAGACVKCTGGGNHREWCKACDGDA